MENINKAALYSLLMVKNSEFYQKALKYSVFILYRGIYFNIFESKN
ncbi:hypothetical protein M2372_004463 [Chryseobacterium sp. BIGb0232]|nr:hypothetical protein [Chryseobacterium sp. BIGb0232]ROS08208.1 hypothetical protein EDF65_4657 [Chryseobacterium nakagawai]